MRKHSGSSLELDLPDAAEREWIFEALQRPQIHLPLSCPRPPSRRMFDQDKIYLVETEGSRVHDVRYFVVRARRGGARAFGVHYGWAFRHDRTREIDLAVPEREDAPAPGIGWLFEAHVLIAAFLFGNDEADRLRWRVRIEGRPLTWYRRLGASCSATIEEPHPLSGEPVSKQVWDLPREAFEAVLKRAGLSIRSTYDRDLWQRLRP